MAKDKVLIFETQGFVEKVEKSCGKRDSIYVPLGHKKAPFTLFWLQMNCSPGPSLAHSEDNVVIASTASRSPFRRNSHSRYILANERIFRICVERKGREPNPQNPAEELTDYKSGGLTSCPTSPYKIGAPGGARTHDLPVNGGKLCRLSYRRIYKTVCGSLPTGFEPATCRLRIDRSQVTASALSRLDSDNEARRLR